MSDKKTTLSRVERKRLARIDGILDTAMTVVAKEGIDGFSLHKLAAELDLTVGAFYRYFPSKMALIGALETKVIKAFGREFRETIERFECHFDDTQSPIMSLTRIMVLCEVYRLNCRRHPERMTLIGNILASPVPVLEPEIAQGVMLEMLSTLSVVGEALGAAVKCGALEDGPAAQRAILVWTSTRGVIHIEKLERHDPVLFHPDNLYRTILDSLLRGWGADLDALKRAHTFKHEFMELIDD